MEVRTRHRQSQAQRRAETRQALLDSAARAFAEHGFHAASVDAIAARAGYSKGAVYGRFADKNDLFLAVFEARFDSRLAAVGAASMNGGNKVKRIEALARAHRQAIGEDPRWTVAWVEFAAHATRIPELSRRLRALNAVLRERAERRIIEAGIVEQRDASYFTTIALIYASGVSVEQMLDPTVVPEVDLTRMARALARDLGTGESNE